MRRLKFHQMPEILRHRRAVSSMYGTYVSVFSAWPEGDSDVGINIFDDDGNACFVSMSNADAVEFARRLLKATADTVQIQNDYDRHMIEETAHDNRHKR